MCGRYTLKATASDLAKTFQAHLRDAVPASFERYNIAPTQQLPIVRHASDGRVVTMARWGFIPHWVGDPSELKSNHINARADRLTKSPMFRPALYRRRCLVPATGFFEWQAQGQKQPKQPYLIHQQDGRIFAFAGLWERWTDPEGNDIDSFTILTTDPNELVKPMHNRMPVVLPRDAWDTWLDPEVCDTNQLMQLLGPPEAKGWKAVPVSRRINSPTNDDPEAVEPVGDVRSA